MLLKAGSSKGLSDIVTLGRKKINWETAKREKKTTTEQYFVLLYEIWTSSKPQRERTNFITETNSQRARF